MYDVLKNLVLILLGFLAPYWFPLTQKIFNGKSITNTELFALLLIFIAPIIGLYFGEKAAKKDRINEMKNAFVEALKEYGVAKEPKS
jgi:hypothetical protein